MSDLTKATRRINPEQAQWAGKIPKHSTEAANLRVVGRASKHGGLGTAEWAGKIPKHSESSAVLRGLRLAKRDAFGVEISKAPRQIMPPFNEVGHKSDNFGPDLGRRINGPAPTSRTGRSRITDMPSKYNIKGNASEFGRGAKGGARATSANWANKSKNARAVRQVVLQRIVSGHTAGSPHPGAFKAGVKAGKVAGHGARFALPAAVVGAVGGINEIKRREQNKRGANLSPLEPYIHPRRADAKDKAARARVAYKTSTRTANRLEASEPGSKRASTVRNRANRHAYSAGQYNQQAVVGHRAARKVSKPYDKTQTYTAPTKIGKSMPGERPVRTELPGDNRDAQMARSRRKVGLGTAGVGFLAATRGKEVAPAVADAATPKFLNGAKHADRIARRSKFVTAASSKVGGAAVIGGLALAGEGAYSDLRNRKAFSRTRQQVRAKVRTKTGKDTVKDKAMTTLGKSAFGVDHDDLSKAIPGLQGLGTRVGAKLGGMSGARTGAKIGTKLDTGIAPIKAKLKPIGAAVKAGALAPAKFTSNGIRPTTAGVGYMAGAGGLGLGLAKPNGNVNKAYEPGSITMHQEQANLHSRRKAAADRRIKGGLTAAGAAGAVGGAMHQYADQIGTFGMSAHGTGDDVVRRGKIIAGLRRAGPRVAIGGAAGGLALAGEGVITRSRNAVKQNKETQKAQLARRSRNASLKKAFDSERSRHSRQDLYAGGATGGAVVAGAGAVQTGRGARMMRRAARVENAAAARSHKDVMTHLMQNKPTSNASAKQAQGAAVGHMRNAEKFAGRARKLNRISVASGVGAAALAGTAYGLHDYDRRRGGRSYGY